MFDDFNRSRQQRIVIDPFEEQQLNPNSYTCRLGNKIKIAPLDVLDPKKKNHWSEIAIPESGMLLEPSRLYLGHTLEKIGSQSFVLLLSGITSMANLGLFLQISANLSQLGPAHCWTLEITVVQPLIIYQGMIIGQVSCWIPEGERFFYDGVYAKISTPLESQILDV